MCNFFQKSESSKYHQKRSDIRIRFSYESSFWIVVSACKLIILPDIQPVNRIVIISGSQSLNRGWVLKFENFPDLDPGSKNLEQDRSRCLEKWLRPPLISGMHRKWSWSQSAGVNSDQSL